jgi:hypothetical protein
MRFDHRQTSKGCCNDNGPAESQVSAVMGFRKAFAVAPQNDLDALDPRSVYARRTQECVFYRVRAQPVSASIRVMNLVRRNEVRENNVSPMRITDSHPVRCWIDLGLINPMEFVLLAKYNI